MSVDALILAAGGSRRLGRPKQLLEFQGEFLLERAIRLATEAGAVRVFAVMGAHFEIIRASVHFSGAIPVINDRWQQGIATSIVAGLHAVDSLGPKPSGVLVMSCDQPRLTADHLRTLIDEFNAQAEPAIVASAYAGVHGVPAIFPRAVFPHLMNLSGDKGARALLAKPPCALIAHEFPGGEIDIDLPADLAHLD